MGDVDIVSDIKKYKILILNLNLIKEKNGELYSKLKPIHSRDNIEIRNFIFCSFIIKNDSNKTDAYIIKLYIEGTESGPFIERHNISTNFSDINNFIVGKISQKFDQGCMLSGIPINNRNNVNRKIYKFHWYDISSYSDKIIAIVVSLGSENNNNNNIKREIRRTGDPVVINIKDVEIMIPIENTIISPIKKEIDINDIVIKNESDIIKKNNCMKFISNNEFIKINILDPFPRDFYQNSELLNPGGKLGLKKENIICSHCLIPPEIGISYNKKDIFNKYLFSKEINANEKQQLFNSRKFNKENDIKDITIIHHKDDNIICKFYTIKNEKIKNSDIINNINIINYNERSYFSDIMEKIQKKDIFEDTCCFMLLISKNDNMNYTYDNCTYLAKEMLYFIKLNQKEVNFNIFDICDKQYWDNRLKNINLLYFNQNDNDFKELKLNHIYNYNNNSNINLTYINILTTWIKKNEKQRIKMSNILKELYKSIIYKPWLISLKEFISQFVIDYYKNHDYYQSIVYINRIIRNFFEKDIERIDNTIRKIEIQNNLDKYTFYNTKLLIDPCDFNILLKRNIPIAENIMEEKKNNELYFDINLLIKYQGTEQHTAVFKKLKDNKYYIKPEILLCIFYNSYFRLLKNNGIFPINDNKPLFYLSFKPNETSTFPFDITKAINIISEYENIIIFTNLSIHVFYIKNSIISKIEAISEGMINDVNFLNEINTFIIPNETSINELLWIYMYYSSSDGLGSRKKLEWVSIIGNYNNNNNWENLDSLNKISQISNRSYFMDNRQLEEAYDTELQELIYKYMIYINTKKHRSIIDNKEKILETYFNISQDSFQIYKTILSDINKSRDIFVKSPSYSNIARDLYNEEKTLFQLFDKLNDSRNMSKINYDIINNSIPNILKNVQILADNYVKMKLWLKAIYEINLINSDDNSATLLISGFDTFNSSFSQLYRINTLIIDNSTFINSFRKIIYSQRYTSLRDIETYTQLKDTFKSDDENIQNLLKNITSISPVKYIYKLNDETQTIQQVNKIEYSYEYTMICLCMSIILQKNSSKNWTKNYKYNNDGNIDFSHKTEKIIDSINGSIINNEFENNNILWDKLLKKIGVINEKNHFLKLNAGNNNISNSIVRSHTIILDSANTDDMNFIDINNDMLSILDKESKHSIGSILSNYFSIIRNKMISEILLDLSNVKMPLYKGKPNNSNIYKTKLKDRLGKDMFEYYLHECSLLIIEYKNKLSKLGNTDSEYVSKYINFLEEKKISQFLPKDKEVIIENEFIGIIKETIKSSIFYYMVIISYIFELHDDIRGKYLVDIRFRNVSSLTGKDISDISNNNENVLEEKIIKNIIFNILNPIIDEHTNIATVFIPGIECNINDLVSICVHLEDITNNFRKTQSDNIILNEQIMKKISPVNDKYFDNAFSNPNNNNNSDDIMIDSFQEINDDNDDDYDDDNSIIMQEEKDHNMDLDENDTNISTHPEINNNNNVNEQEIALIQLDLPTADLISGHGVEFINTDNKIILEYYISNLCIVLDDFIHITNNKDNKIYIQKDVFSMDKYVNILQDENKIFGNTTPTEDINIYRRYLSDTRINYEIIAYNNDNHRNKIRNILLYDILDTKPTIQYIPSEILIILNSEYNKDYIIENKNKEQQLEALNGLYNTICFRIEENGKYIWVQKLSDEMYIELNTEDLQFIFDKCRIIIYEKKIITIASSANTENIQMTEYDVSEDHVMVESIKPFKITFDNKKEQYDDFISNVITESNNIYEGINSFLKETRDKLGRELEDKLFIIEDIGSIYGSIKSMDGIFYIWLSYLEFYEHINDDDVEKYNNIDFFEKIINDEIKKSNITQDDILKIGWIIKNSVDTVPFEEFKQSLSFNKEISNASYYIYNFLYNIKELKEKYNLIQANNNSTIEDDQIPMQIDNNNINEPIIPSNDIKNNIINQQASEMQYDFNNINIDESVTNDLLNSLSEFLSMPLDGDQIPPLLNEDQNINPPPIKKIFSKYGNIIAKNTDNQKDHIFTSIEKSDLYIQKILTFSSELKNIIVDNDDDDNNNNTKRKRKKQKPLNKNDNNFFSHKMVKISSDIKKELIKTYKEEYPYTISVFNLQKNLNYPYEPVDFVYDTLFHLINHLAYNFANKENTLIIEKYTKLFDKYHPIFGERELLSLDIFAIKYFICAKEELDDNFSISYIKKDTHNDGLYTNETFYLHNGANEIEKRKSLLEKPLLISALQSHNAVFFPYLINNKMNKIIKESPIYKVESNIIIPSSICNIEKKFRPNPYNNNNNKDNNIFQTRNIINGIYRPSLSFYNYNIIKNYDLISGLSYCLSVYLDKTEKYINERYIKKIRTEASYKKLIDITSKEDSFNNAISRRSISPHWYNLIRIILHTFGVILDEKVGLYSAKEFRIKQNKNKNNTIIKKIYFSRYDNEIRTNNGNGYLSSSLALMPYEYNRVLQLVFEPQSIDGQYLKIYRPQSTSENSNIIIHRKYLTRIMTNIGGTGNIFLNYIQEFKDQTGAKEIKFMHVINNDNSDIVLLSISINLLNDRNDITIIRTSQIYQHIRKLIKYFSSDEWGQLSCDLLKYKNYVKRICINPNYLWIYIISSILIQNMDTHNLIISDINNKGETGDIIKNINSRRIWSFLIYIHDDLGNESFICCSINNTSIHGTERYTWKVLSYLNHIDKSPLAFYEKEKSHIEMLKFIKANITDKFGVDYQSPTFNSQYNGFCIQRRFL